MTVLFQYLPGENERLLPKIFGAYAFLSGQRMVAAQKHSPAIGGRAWNPLILCGIHAAINYRDINQSFIKTSSTIPPSPLLSPDGRRIIQKSPSSTPCVFAILSAYSQIHAGTYG